MKQYLFFTLTALVLLPSIVFAESDENVTKRRPDNQTNVQIQEVRQDLNENRDGISNKVAQNHANRLKRRFQFYYDRFTNIIARFKARLAILEGQGKNITAVTAKLDLAKTKLEEAKAKGIEAVAAFVAIDPAKFSQQKTERLAARDLANAAHQLFVDTHNLLKDALKELKTISKPALPAASPAVENAE